jgi:pyrrolidone-carboxylate peptidase
MVLIKLNEPFVKKKVDFFLGTNKVHILEVNIIEIPSWWDKSIDSLKSTIYQCRPDLISSISPNATAIPNSPPQSQGIST